jgi:hypothetical protein
VPKLTRSGSGNEYMNELIDKFGYQPRIAQAIVQVRSGTPEPYYDDILVADWEYSHRLAYAAAGATGFTFFNVAEAKGIIDMPGNGAGLPKNHAFIYTGCGFHLETGVDINAAIDANGAQLQLSAVETHPGTTEFPLKTGEQLRLALQNGDVSVFLNNNVIDRFYGLMRAPAAAGAHMEVAVGGTTTAPQTVSAIVVNNGQPTFANRRTVRPQLFMHNSPIKVQVDYTTAIALTAAGVLTCRLWGTLIKPRS